MWNSLRVRLLMLTAIVVLVAVSVTAFVASRRTAGEFVRFRESAGSVQYRRYSDVLSRSFVVNYNWEGIQAEVERVAELSGHRVVVSNQYGTVVGDSQKDLVGERVATSWGPPAAGIVVNGRLVGALFVDPADAEARPAEAAFLSAVNRSVLLGALAAALAGVVVTLALSGRILRPVQDLTFAAQRMEKGDLSARVEVSTEDEIGQLAHAFNAMAGSLAQQEQLRRNLVGDVAHELRTPLTNLWGYLQAARDGLVKPDAALIDNLYEETALLNRLVADLQELAQAEAGQIGLVRAPADIAGIVEQTVGMFRLQAEAKGLSLRVELPADLPAVDVDRERVGQVLRNLLANAAAYTPAGGEICVAAQATAGEVAVSVADTGSGISPEDLPHVFERFYRADRSRSRGTGGAGLGLTIVRQLVAAHGGTVSAAGTVGEGSTFTFTLPIAHEERGSGNGEP